MFFPIPYATVSFEVENLVPPEKVKTDPGG